ncbi:MAG: Rnase Y domain-containing protein, partial [Chitinophagaceae bacterium]
MDPNILYIIIGAVALLAGLIVGKLVFARNTTRKLEEAELQSQTILKEAELRAENIRKEKELDAKERFVQMKSAHDKEVFEKNKKINDSENRARQKEQSIIQKETGLDKQIKDNDIIKENLNRQIELVNIKRTELEKH